MQLEAQSVDVDFASYRSTLKNQSIVDEIEKAVRGYQVKKVDVSRQIKAIESFEATAIKSAEETKGQVEKELKDLEATLQNIQGARPFEDLTVVCDGKTMVHATVACTTNRQGIADERSQDEVMAAQPEIEKRVEKMVSNHRWMPPGYKVRLRGRSIALG